MPQPQIIALGGAAIHFIGKEPARIITSRPNARA